MQGSFSGTETISYLPSGNEVISRPMSKPTKHKITNCVHNYSIRAVHVACPHSKVHGAIMGPTWGLLAPGGSHLGPMTLAVWVVLWWMFHPLALGWYHMCYAHFHRIHRCSVMGTGTIHVWHGEYLFTNSLVWSSWSSLKHGQAHKKSNTLKNVENSLCIGTFRFPLQNRRTCL